jgi:hypothetical protein
MFGVSLMFGLELFLGWDLEFEFLGFLYRAFH